jgi:8-oxo-dGTP diphosphatase
MENNFRNAAKAFIIEDSKLLLLKRRPNDPHKPGAWDVPGGRLELGEDPFQGLQREVREETTLGINIVMPVSVHHFIREDGQKITLTIYLCELASGEVKLSEEHTEYKWIPIEDAPNQLSKFFEPTFDNLKRIKFD